MKEKKKSNVPLLLDFLKGSKAFMVLAVIFNIAISVLELFNPKIIGVAVDSVIGDEPAEGIVAEIIGFLGGAEYLRAHLLIVGGIIVGIAFVTALIRIALRYTNSMAAETLVERMRNLVFDHIEHLPFSWHMKNNTGDIIQRCTSDIDTVKNFLANQLTTVVRIVALIVISIAMMAGIDWRLTMIAVAMTPIIICYSFFFNKKIGKAFLACDENEGILSAIVQENLTGVRVVRAFGREKYEREKFETQNGKYADMWMRLNRLMAWFWASGDFLSSIQLLTVLVLGAVFASEGTLTTGEFMTFIAFNSMLVWPVRQLGRTISEMSKANISIERIAYIMDSEIEHDKPNAVEPSFDGDIVFDNVTFAYDGGKKILDGVSFTAKKGTTVGILGGTGSGKSTLMYLLTRLYEIPEGSGKITIGGVDIAEMKAESLRRGVGTVLQEPFLFSRSIAENIGITRDAGIDEVRKAAKIACLDDAVTSFPKGYDTFVGERGVTLSGGQKQRAAIARMLVGKAPVMIFDDSLSAVDAETDAKIRAALEANLGESTVFLISQRLTTLMSADKIIVLDGGRIIEEGTHDELVAKGGVYAEIFALQMAGSEVGDDGRE